MHYLPDRFPFGRLEDRLAIHLRATTAQTAHVQCPPSNNDVYRQTSQQTSICSNNRSSIGSPIQNAKEDFDHPPNTIILNDLLHLFHGVDGQTAQQQPFDRRIVGRRIHFADNTTFTVTGGSFAIRAPWRTECHAGSPHDNLSLARLTRLTPPTGVASDFCLSPTDLDRFVEQHGLLQDVLTDVLFPGFLAIFAKQSTILTGRTIQSIVRGSRVPSASTS